MRGRTDVPPDRSLLADALTICNNAAIGSRAQARPGPQLVIS
ncbi:hypothetical protein [Rubidibacter lacunae]|nr:hypothetical protein [Rubidibacter lacunae]